jgi:hypothetical protein
MVASSLATSAFLDLTRARGGKFLLLPPDYKGAVPEGYFVYRSATNSVFVFLRGFYTDPKNLTPAVAHLERTKIYPLNGEAGAKPMTFPDASGVPANLLPVSDGSVFDQLKLLVDREGAALAGPDWLGMLASIGIAKGQPFTPDANTRTILDRAAKTAYKMSRVIGFEENLSGRSLRVYSDRRWFNPFADGTPAIHGAFEPGWENVAGRYIDLDARIWMFTDYYSISPGWCPKSGQGRQVRDRLHRWRRHALGVAATIADLPANIPGRELLVGDTLRSENASGLANGQPSRRSDRATSRRRTRTAARTSIWAESAAGKEGNWLATVPGRGYFAILRLYGPTEAAIDKSWKPAIGGE